MTWVSPTGFVYQEGDTDVLTAAVSRVSQMFDEGISVFVSFSGGKDSTCVLHLCMSEAVRRGLLPLDVVYMDEEVIDPDTVAYIEAVKALETVRFHHVCHPVRHTLRSQTRSAWYPWDNDYREVWARPLPEGAVCDVGLGDEKDLGYGDVLKAYIRNCLGLEQVINAAGIRIQESQNRRRGVLSSGGWGKFSDRGNAFVKPIFDWRWQDVWLAIKTYEWPYSAYYDKAQTLGIHPHKQRIAAWGNVADADVRLYQAFYSDFWEKAVIRIPELDTVARYRHSNLYRVHLDKPTGVSLASYALYLLTTLNDDDREYWTGVIENTLRRWKKKSTAPLPMFPWGGPCWKKLVEAIVKNDRPGRGKASRDLI